MTYSNRHLKRFGRLSVLSQSSVIVFFAIMGAEALTLVFYSIFFADRLWLDLLLTAVIVVAVGFPLAYFFIGQQVKLAIMAAQLDHSAKTDGLTGLLNRGAFFEDVSLAIARGDAIVGAFLFIDVDHFKSINDTYGHAAGDRVLRELAAILLSSVRTNDLVARLGGEEFGIYLDKIDHAGAMVVAEHVRHNVGALKRDDPSAPHRVTVSIGVCVRRHGQTLEDLLMEADRNLYAAKTQGRNLVVDDVPSTAVGSGRAAASG